MNKTFKRIIWILLIILIVSFFIGKKMWDDQFMPANSTDNTAKIFVVEKGEGVSSITERLKEKGLIKSDFGFKMYLKQNNMGGKIQAGSFRLSPSMSVAEIVKNLTQNPLDHWVTLLEGWRVEEMAEKFNKELGVDRELFIKQAKEGYLFPDTYLFQKGVAVEQIIKKLEGTFDSRYSPEIKSKIKALGLTEDEGVILASIVEREARSDEVRTNVASILLKRLNIGMGLNADATIQYALGYQPTEKTWWKKSLSLDDLKFESKYNTYLYKGLPPTPICNPSISSLQAVANANPKTPYLYYIHDNQGNSYYAKTLDEHNSNVEKYLR
jgi:UPF0755 protein